VPCLQDVPAALNGLLDSLPSKVSIQGLPFDAVFTYALYTLNYVIVKVRLHLPNTFLKRYIERAAIDSNLGSQRSPVMTLNPGSSTRGCGRTVVLGDTHGMY
jgi:hypothetical protein